MLTNCSGIMRMSGTSQEPLEPCTSTSSKDSFLSASHGVGDDGRFAVAQCCTGCTGCNSSTSVPLRQYCGHLFVPLFLPPGSFGASGENLRDGNGMTNDRRNGEPPDSLRVFTKGQDGWRIWGDSPEIVRRECFLASKLFQNLSHCAWICMDASLRKGAKTSPEAHPCRNPGCPLTHDPCPSLAEAQLPNLPAPLKVWC